MSVQNIFSGISANFFSEVFARSPIQKAFAQKAFAQKAFAKKTFSNVLSGVLGGVCGGLMTSPALAESAVDLAQVNNADLACYLNDLGGVQYDLTALCGGGIASEQAVVLQTGDVQVTLRWNTADDLDLYVRDPEGDEVFYGNPSVASGGQLDIDANLGCVERMAEPVENIFWPTGGGVPGNYVVRVELYSFCGGSAPIDFTLTTLVRGETQSYTGRVGEGQESMSFPFTFSAASGESAPARTPAGTPSAIPAATLPPIPAPPASR